MGNRHNLTEYTMFAEAWFALATARCMLVFMPFRKLMPLLSKKQPHRPAAVNNNLLINLSIAVARAGKRSPWRTQCFEQALAAKLMLRRRHLPSIIYFGIKKSEPSIGKLRAHAWLDCNGLRITGGNQISHFTVLGCFES